MSMLIQWFAQLQTVPGTTPEFGEIAMFIDQHSQLSVDIKHTCTYLSRIWQGHQKVIKDLLPRKVGTKPPTAATLLKRREAAIKVLNAEVRLPLNKAAKPAAKQESTEPKTDYRYYRADAHVRVTVIARIDLLNKNQGVAHPYVAFIRLNSAPQLWIRLERIPNLRLPSSQHSESR